MTHAGTDCSAGVVRWGHDQLIILPNTQHMPVDQNPNQILQIDLLKPRKLYYRVPTQTKLKTRFRN